jgi:two-component system chemotaxis sensor kinase CheA
VLSDAQAHELIFMPGLSTAEYTTDLSGRGVGMDIVRRSIRELGGSVELHSEPGKGTTTTITLPLTVGIVHERQTGT